MTCHHPSARLYAWWALNPTTGDADLLCVGCRACGAVLQGGADLSDEHTPEHGYETEHWNILHDSEG